MNLKRYLPTKEQLRKMRSLGFLGEVIFEPNLWHFNRYSVSYAMLVGGICCFLPIPFQMIPALAICVAVRCNVPITVLIVWISNPFTLPPMMLFAYKVGAALMGQEGSLGTITFTVEWFTNQFLQVWQPLLLGCLVCGTTMGVTGFVAVRIYYRWRIARYQQHRASRSAGPPKA